MTTIIQDILKLSVPERILMVEAIWDSIAESSNKLEPTEEVKELLDRRIKAHNANPNEGISWENVKSRIHD